MPMGFRGVTLAEFKLLYPSFKAADDAWITAVLAQSEALIGDTVAAGEKRELLVGLTTASTLARSPQGRAANLSSKDGQSVFSRELDRVRAGHACGLLRLG